MIRLTLVGIILIALYFSLVHQGVIPAPDIKGMYPRAGTYQMAIIPCDTDSDCQEKNPSLGNF